MTSHAKSCQVCREGLQVPIRSESQQYDQQTDQPTDRPTWSGIELLRAAKKDAAYFCWHTAIMHHRTAEQQVEVGWLKFLATLSSSIPDHVSLSVLLLNY